MPTLSAIARLRQLVFHRQHANRHLASPSSYVARAAAVISATLLICASSGLGAYYASALGAEHSILLAGFGIVMALGLELAKPFSIAAAFDALRRWRIVQGMLLAALGLMAVAYSLSAELSLMATARSDRVAERAAESGVAIKARSRYERAKLEIDRLPTARPTSELQSLIDGVLINPLAGGCVAIDGPFTQEHCPEVAKWKAEQARAQRRSQLETTMRQAERDMASGPVAKAADPGAASLAAYLAIFGLKAEPDLLTEVLILVGVLALEIGSALAVVLVQAVSGVASRKPFAIVNRPRVNQSLVPASNPINAGVTSNRQQVKDRLLDHLAQSGGELANSERGLAALIGASRPTVRRAIHGLVAGGLIALEATRNGTVLRLVA